MSNKNYPTHVKIKLPGIYQELVVPPYKLQDVLSALADDQYCGVYDCMYDGFDPTKRCDGFPEVRYLRLVESEFDAMARKQAEQSAKSAENSLEYYRKLFTKAEAQIKELSEQIEALTAQLQTPDSEA